MVKGTINVIEVIEMTDGERFYSLSYILHTDNGKVEEIISYSQLADHLEATTNEETRPMMTYTSSQR